MSFDVGAEQYDRFMGRYSVPLAAEFADFAGIATGQRAIDVGCGSGALTRELVERLGADRVSAVDPAQLFVAAIRERLPGVRVDLASAEALPYMDSQFDVAVAQLVVHFMAEPLVGVREMARVTSSGGVVAACVWDHTGGRGPLSMFWDVARELDRSVQGEARRAGTREGDLGPLFEAVGLREIEESSLTVDVGHPSFDEWWEPFTLGVGPAGRHVAQLRSDDQARLREACRARLPSAPFVISALAWVARGRV
ncbi:MAG TPA: class I SAM-dependent methyltransferase [Solirubrobacteraceae bacterium]